ncbi:matrixin family metalloprotease [Chondromyces crocatus]|uniref:Exported protease n=1 Tax=Chondromyces crocatus TaxID=52 RepID=A0A0K1EML3_CHOCO|nr:matrixin family metalloprotease [Chondromyces crocatus]AKT41882.1 exported protease [Chondromyces crocatus]
MASGSRASAVVVASAFALLATSEAAAYCRSTTCRGVDACDGEIIEGCLPLQWKRSCIGFALQEDASSDVTLERANEALDAAFDAWQTADCGGATPGISVENMGTVTCDQTEYNKKAGNANILVFRDEVWPHVDGQHNIALTTVSYDPRNGELYNADIEVNTANYEFVDGDMYDLRSVLTHEAGHFLGMGHALTDDATMRPVYDVYSTDFRVLSPDDAAGICATYPPREEGSGHCNPIPRHGFARECGDDQAPGRCGMSPASASTAGGGAIALFGMSVMVAAVRRRRRTWVRRGEIKGRSGPPPG